MHTGRKGRLHTRGGGRIRKTEGEGQGITFLRRPRLNCIRPFVSEIILSVTCNLSAVAFQLLKRGLEYRRVRYDSNLDPEDIFSQLCSQVYQVVLQHTCGSEDNDLFHEVMLGLGRQQEE